MENIDVTDMTLPETWKCQAYQGWPSMYDEDSYSVEFVQIAGVSSYLPARFELRVEVPLAGERSRVLVMLFQVPPDRGSIVFSAAFAPALDADVDELLAEAKRLHRIDWWKLKVIDQMHAQLRDVVLGAVGSWAGEGSQDVLDVENAMRVGRSRATALSVGRRRNRVTAEDLDRVAAAYNLAKEEGRPTTRAVAEALSVSLSRAAHLVGDARKLGKIDPVDPK